MGVGGVDVMRGDSCWESKGAEIWCEYVGVGWEWWAWLHVVKICEGISGILHVTATKASSLCWLLGDAVFGPKGVQSMGGWEASSWLFTVVTRLTAVSCCGSSTRAMEVGSCDLPSCDCSWLEVKPLVGDWLRFSPLWGGDWFVSSQRFSSSSWPPWKLFAWRGGAPCSWSSDISSWSFTVIDGWRSLERIEAVDVGGDSPSGWFVRVCGNCICGLWAVCCWLSNLFDRLGLGSGGDGSLRSGGGSLVNFGGFLKDFLGGSKNLWNSSRG